MLNDRYQKSAMGWDRNEKRKELFSKSSYFIVLKDDVDSLVSFVNWRFDVEECHEDDQVARMDGEVVEVAYW